MTFFRYMPKLRYPYEGKLVDQDNIHVDYIDSIDLLTRFRLNDEILNNPLAFYEYEWKDYDRPDIVAKLYYGDVSFAWLVLFSGKIMDVNYGFPLSGRAFNDYLMKKYNVVEPTSLDNTTHHYEDSEGYVIDYDTFQTLPASKRKEVSVFDWEWSENEKKRIIRLISREYAAQISREYEAKLKELRESRDD